MPPTPFADRLVLDDATAQDLANKFGTPLYVLSESHLRDRVRSYLRAFRAAWPNSALTYASKANSTLAVLQIVAQEGCLIDVASIGELEAAGRAGVPASRCHFHGNFKKEEDLRFALQAGVEQIMVDSFDELATLHRLGHEFSLPQLMLRIAPGVNPATNAKISTGQDDTKFGFNLANGAAERAMRFCRDHGLPFHGLHAHVGSQLLEPGAQRDAGVALAQLAKIAGSLGLTVREINVGGGLGVRYLPEHQPMAVDDYCRLVVDAIKAEMPDLPPHCTLTQEPGRALVAECGVTLYTVGPIKTVPVEHGARTYLSIDGGLSDNPRPALYGGVYEVLPIAPRTQCGSGYRIVGRHCETDLLIENVILPEDLQYGDLVQVLCTGAYNSSMASNYNRFLRPATVMLREDGTAQIVQHRETLDQLFAREILLEETHA